MYISFYDGYVGRILFPKGQQSRWISEILHKYQISIDHLANICGLSSRTIRDWRKEKFTVSEAALLRIINKFNINYPLDIKQLSDYWYVIKGSKLGAKKRLELYGPPGTPEGRRKGGKISQQRRKMFPDLYRNCVKRKIYIMPNRSERLAELVGIILGDGGITKYQLKITLNKNTESGYIEFVSRLFNELFREYPQRYYYGGRKNSVCILCLGGIELIEFLKEIGLDKRNKVKMQAGVPDWIKRNERYKRACLRGLEDTDGCVYYHKHKTKGFKCFNIGWTLTNHSKKILLFVYNTLFNNGFTPKLKEHSVYLYKETEVVKYFDIIGSHNPHHLDRFKKYRELKSKWRSTQVADEARLESV